MLQSRGFARFPGPLDPPPAALVRPRGPKGAGTLVPSYPVGGTAPPPSMPRRDDLESILIIGSGPIVIGQACEFDYSGTQACKALREEGYRVILVNSNPATIMTDPETADATYVEPITVESVSKILRKEMPDAILPTMGGQTGLNTALALYDSGILDELGIEMIGADAAVIRKAEDRDLFRAAMTPLRPVERALGASPTRWRTRAGCWARSACPASSGPASPWAARGGGIAYNVEEFEEICSRGLALSMNSEILVEESLLGWKEFEMEVMRDRADNVVIVCSIENFDPMGVHTGDSITVAPAQTLTDREYQDLRNASIVIMREIGVECGGSNVQFAINPEDGRMIVIEMNPRVSRSSALASKATGFPIAKFAAKLACGYTLDEIQNDITKETPACFEPTIDYCVTKIPRFAFEKFPGADPTLTTQMKSVGETMAIGRTFKESLQKAVRGLETGRPGLGLDPKNPGRRPGLGPPGADARPARAQPQPALRRARRLPRRLEHRRDPRGLQDRPVVPREHPRAGRLRARAGRGAPDQGPVARGQAAGLLRPPDRPRRRHHARRRGRPARGVRPERGVQAGRHLRRGVRGLHALLLLRPGRTRTRRAGPTAARS